MVGSSRCAARTIGLAYRSGIWTKELQCRNRCAGARVGYGGCAGRLRMPRKVARYLSSLTYYYLSSAFWTAFTLWAATQPDWTQKCEHRDLRRLGWWRTHATSDRADVQLLYGHAETMYGSCETRHEWASVSLTDWVSGPEKRIQRPADLAWCAVRCSRHAPVDRARNLRSPHCSGSTCAQCHWPSRA